VDLGQERRPDQHDGGEQKRGDPISRDDAGDPSPEEYAWRLIAAGRDRPDDEAADDEEDVDARRADPERVAQPLEGVEDDDRDCRQAAQRLDRDECGLARGLCQGAIPRAR
jgi:hypothetical protein